MTILYTVSQGYEIHFLPGRLLHRLYGQMWYHWKGLDVTRPLPGVVALPTGAVLRKSVTKVTALPYSGQIDYQFQISFTQELCQIE